MHKLKMKKKTNKKGRKKCAKEMPKNECLAWSAFARINHYSIIKCGLKIKVKTVPNIDTTYLHSVI